MSTESATREAVGLEAENAFRLLFFVEGFTDIRFILGLSQLADLTLCVPAAAYTTSGLKERVAISGISVRVVEIPGGRLQFQQRSLLWLWRHAREFDVILSQEVLRGSLNATLVGWALGVPVVTYMGIAPLEYFRCRRERRRIGLLTSVIGELAIRTMMTINGRLASRCLAMGPYLQGVAARYCPRSSIGLYYGVDTSFFRPADAEERRRLRTKRDLPADRFLIFFSSRISHEKDPETVLRAVALMRAQGIDAVLLNLGGGYQEFIALARDLGLPNPDAWVLGRPAVHPMTEVADYFRCADAVALASLAEGAAFSTLEALAAGTPVVASAVGGMAVQLKDVAQLVPRRDPAAMAEALLWVATHPEEARAQALEGRKRVEQHWSRERAFGELAGLLREVAEEARSRA